MLPYYGMGRRMPSVNFLKCIRYCIGIVRGVGGVDRPS